MIAAVQRYLRAFLLVVLVPFGAAGAAQPPTVTFDINPQPLNLALTQFAQQSGLQVVFVAEIGRDFNSSGLAGAYTPQEALQQLLASTPFDYDFINPRTVTIRLLKQKVQVGSGDVAAGIGNGVAMRLARTDP